MAGLTREQAVALHESKFWESQTYRQRAEFQLFEERLCMPFGVFHEAIEKTLGRPVFTHEFAFIDGLRKEFLGERSAPSLEEIINLIPEEKRLVVVTP